MIKVGDVWIDENYRHEYKIGKIYKNGNFVFEGEKQQRYVIYQSDGTISRASTTGKYFYGNLQFFPLTDERKIKRAKMLKYYDACKVIEMEITRLDRIRYRRGGNYDEVIATAERITGP